jgi:hypothetical protein
MSKLKCSECNRIAIWLYMPGKIDNAYCDLHVPRGCTCNDYPIDDDYDNLNPENWKEEIDEQGRRSPCCEYMYDEEGFDND